MNYPHIHRPPSVLRAIFDTFTAAHILNVVVAGDIVISIPINKKHGSSSRPQPGKTWSWSIFGSFCLIIGVTLMTLNTIHWLNHSQLKCHKQSLSLHIAAEGNCSIENQAAGCKTVQVEELCLISLLMWRNLTKHHDCHSPPTLFVTQLQVTIHSPAFHWTFVCLGVDICLDVNQNSELKGKS